MRQGEGQQETLVSKKNHQSEKLQVETLNEANPTGPFLEGLVFLLSKNKKV